MRGSLLLAVICSLWTAGAATAQNVYGSLVGNVTDTIGRGHSRRDRDRDPYRHEPHARSRDQRERRVLDSQHSVGDLSGCRRRAWLSDVYGPRRHRHQPRRARRREAGPRHARGSADGHGDRRDSADRERRRAAHRKQRAAADAADERPRVSELHDADARRRRPELSAVGRHQQPRPHDVADDQRPAGDQHGRAARRHHRDESVLREHPELRPQPRGDRDRQRRHEQLRRRPGDGRRGRGERAGEDGHEQLPRFGVRVRDRCAHARAQLLSCRPSATRARRACTCLAARWAARSSRTSCSSSSATRRRASGRSTATPRGRPEPAGSCRCRRRICAAAISRAARHRFTTR